MIKIIFLGLVFFFQHTKAFASEFQIRCFDRDVKLISKCFDRLQRHCTSQELVINNKVVSLASQKDRAMWAESWKCIKGAKQDYLILGFNNGGSCAECEVNEIFNSAGDRLTKRYQNFSQAYKKLNLPSPLPELDSLDIFK
jgi:hypothetical protein